MPKLEKIIVSKTISNSIWEKRTKELSLKPLKMQSQTRTTNQFPPKTQNNAEFLLKKEKTRSPENVILRTLENQFQKQFKQPS